MNKMIGLALEVGTAHLQHGAWKLGGVYDVRVSYVTRPQHAFDIRIVRRRDLRGPRAPKRAS